MFMTKLTTAKILVSNLKMLMKEHKITGNRHLSRISGVSDRMIGKILNHESIPTIEITEKLADAFGMTGWQLIIPSLKTDITKMKELEDVLKNYMEASDRDREVIAHVAENTGPRYAKTNTPR